MREDIFDAVRELLNRDGVRGSVRFDKGVKPGELTVELNLRGRAQSMEPIVKTIAQDKNAT